MQLGWPCLLVAGATDTDCCCAPCLPRPCCSPTTPVLDPGRGRTKTGRLWCYAVDPRPWNGPGHPAAAYVYSDDRRGVHPAEHLRDFSGVIQVDGYQGFGAVLRGEAGATRQLAYCFAHYL